MNLNYKKKSKNKALNEDPNIATVERNTGIDFSNVKIHYASTEPDKYEAAAFTRGNHIHIKQGKTHFIPHELGHVVQQRRGIVKPTGIVNGIKINQDKKMEESANTALNNNMSFDARISTDILQLGREHVATIYTFRHQPQKVEPTLNDEITEAVIAEEGNEILNEIDQNEMDEEVLAAARADSMENLAADATIEGAAEIEVLEMGMSAVEQIITYGIETADSEEETADSEEETADSEEKSAEISVSELNRELILSIAKKRLFGPHTIANVFLDLMVELYDTKEIFDEQILPYPIEKVQEIVAQEISANPDVMDVLTPYFEYYVFLYTESTGILDRLKEIGNQAANNQEEISLLSEKLQDYTYKLLNLNPYAVYGWNGTEKAGKDALKGKGESTIATSLRYIYELFNGKLIVVPPYILKRIIDSGESFVKKEGYNEFLFLRLKDIQHPDLPLASASLLNNDFDMIKAMLNFYDSIYFNKINLALDEHSYILDKLVGVLDKPEAANYNEVYELFDTIKDDMNLPISWDIRSLESILAYTPQKNYMAFEISPDETTKEEMEVFNINEKEFNDNQKTELYKNNKGTILKYLANEFLRYRNEFYQLYNELSGHGVHDAISSLIKIVENASKEDKTAQDTEEFNNILHRGEFNFLDESAKEPALHRTLNQTINIIKAFITH